MDSYIDISAHVVVSLSLGYVIWKVFGFNDRKTLFTSLFFAFVGGVLIDIDHFLDHFLSFGFNFNYDYFIRGEYFLRSGKEYIFFHGFEYVIIFGLMAILSKSKKMKMILSVFTLTMFFHLLIDIFLLTNPVREYFILYRLFHGFNADMTGGILD